MRSGSLSVVLVLAFVLALAGGCSSGGGGGRGSSGTGSGSGAGTTIGPGPAPATPSDDPDHWTVDTTRDYDPVVSPPRWIVPSPALPAATAPVLAANNNVAIAFHDGRLFFAWRTAETHFASSNARMHIISSPDRGATWDHEHTIALGADVREPSFLSIGGRLLFHYFEAGTNPLAFEPKHLWRIERAGPGVWSAPVQAGAPGEVPWDLKVRGGRAWMTSYKGGHYQLTGMPQVEVYFKTSPDGISWTAADPSRAAVYTGGVSEVGFEFDETGSLWAVTRNEDGDATGFGAHLATGPVAGAGPWSFPAPCDPERYDSPRLFRHGDDIYLVARRDVNGPFDLGLDALPFDVRRWTYLLAYSGRPKGTTLYRIDRAARRIVPVVDLPGNGDTAFPSVARLDAHRFLVANYTSSLGNPGRSWIEGQLSPDGTQIYLVTIELVPR